MRKIAGPLLVVESDYFEIDLLIETDTSIDVAEARSNFWINVVNP